MSPRRLLIALALLPALLFPTAADAAKRRPRGLWFAVDTVDVRGTMRQDSGLGSSPRFVYGGVARYESATDRQGIWNLTPTNGRVTSFTAESLEYTGSSIATATEETGTVFTCSLGATPSGFAPTRLPATAFFSKSELRLNFTLVWPAVRCPDNAPAWNHPIIPVDAGEQRYPLSRFTKVRPGRFVTLRIDIADAWDDDPGQSTIAWSGKLVLERLTDDGRYCADVRKGGKRRC
jgi:hypothetical protein